MLDLTLVASKSFVPHGCHSVGGNVVSESSVTLIANIFSACSAIAHHKDDDYERNEQNQTGHRIYSVMVRNKCYKYIHISIDTYIYIFIYEYGRL